LELIVTAGFKIAEHFARTICIKWYTRYTCGCEKDYEFEQREERRGSNLECHSIRRAKAKESKNYCSLHLVVPS
jgi:hypothetical protein